MRIKFNLPDEVLYTTEYQVAITDINYGNHLGNDKILGIAHEARMRYLRSKGYKHELDFPNNAGMIMADAAIMFRGEAFYGDLLTVQIGIDNIHKMGFDMFYGMVRKSDSIEIARVKTAILFMDYDSRKLCSIPQGFV